ALHEPGDTRGTAPADHRLRAGPGLPGRAMARRPASFRAAAQRGQGAPGPAGSGNGPAGRADTGGVVGPAEEAAAGQAACGRVRRLAETAVRVDGKMVFAPDAVSPPDPLSALSEGGAGAYRKAARRSCPGWPPDGRDGAVAGAIPAGRIR